MEQFVHLHVHSEYSLLDGAARISDLIAKAKALGQPAIAITDHGAMYGVIDFYTEAKKAGVKPIIGCEMYIIDGNLRDTETRNREYGHLVLLAKNQQGYENLMKLCSIGFVDGFYYKPRIDYATLFQYKEGLIALSACLAGDLPHMLLQGEKEGAYALARRMKEAFGEDFYIELQDHGLEEQKRVAPLLIAMAKELDLPMVVTNDIHYVEKEDAKAQEVLMCIQMARTLREGGLFQTDEFYLKDQKEMEALFPALPEAIANTAKIAEKCNVEIALGQFHLPTYHIPKEFESHQAYLEHLARAGMQKRYASPAQYEERLVYELSVIEKMGFTDYFLIVWDYVHFSHEQGIRVGPGRGSAAGSIVAYALGITDIDPMEFNLLFERFLNPGRVSMPDIDIDFCIERRQEVIDYVIQKYGEDHVAQIITFGTLGAKQVIRDVARVLEIPLKEADRIAKMIPFELKMTIQKALSISDRLRREYETSPQTKEWLDMAVKLEGMPRQSSTHAAGIVISEKPITAYVPLSRNKKDEGITTQYHMKNLSDLGLLKMDLLGLRTLTVIKDAMELIRESTGQELDMDQIPKEDAKVYQLISSGETDGVFQLESGGMRNLMTQLRPQNLGDIMVGISLFRPGPMAKIPDYIYNKEHPEAIRYRHPILEPILKDTYGCMVYQEQVMEIVRDMAGYSLARSDDVRRTMSKKKMEAMEKEREVFIYGNDTVEGAMKRGVPKETAEAVFDDMVSFAQYAFNKSHACAYAVVAYQTAYLKCYYPVEFMTALLNSFLANSDKIAHYMRCLKRAGVAVLPPDINQSSWGFKVEGQAIRFGLSALKQVGDCVMQTIALREKDGAYVDFEDFVFRNIGILNKGQMESMILSGCFDRMGWNRAQLMAGLDAVYKNAQNEAKQRKTGQMSLFDFSSEVKKMAQIKMPDLPEYPHLKKLMLEKEKTGLFITGHPLDEYVDKIGEGKIGQILGTGENGKRKYFDGDKIELIGLFSSIKTRVTKQSRKMMANGVFEDLTGSISVILYPQAFSQYEGKIHSDQLLRITGRLSMQEEGNPELVLESLSAFEEEKKTEKKQLLYLCLERLDAEIVQQLKKLLKQFPGEETVRAVVQQPKKRVYEMEEKVRYGKDLQEALERLLGKENIAFR